MIFTCPHCQTNALLRVLVVGNSYKCDTCGREFCQDFLERAFGKTQRQGGDGQQGGTHYAGKVDPWELQRTMQTSGSAFVDARRADAIKYAWRNKGNLLEDLRKAKHCLEAAIDHIVSNEDTQKHA